MACAASGQNGDAARRVLFRGRGDNFSALIIDCELEQAFVALRVTIPYYNDGRAFAPPGGTDDRGMPKASPPPMTRIVTTTYRYKPPGGPRQARVVRQSTRSTDAMAMIVGGSWPYDGDDGPSPEAAALAVARRRLILGEPPASHGLL
jgi:hypothetical protein